MTGTPVETLVARCLTDPRYLKGLKAGPPGLMPERELERLRLFSGFICKVQHNDLWDDLPGTRQLMHRYRIELGVFCDYRVVLSGRNGNRMRREEKVREFARFLEDRIRSGRHPDCPGLFEVLRHERNLWEVSLPQAPGSRLHNEGPAMTPAPTEGETATGPRVPWSQFLGLIPRFIGGFRIERHARDPAPILEALRAGARDLPCRRSAVVLGYWAPPGRERRVLRLEPVQTAILSAINGRRRIRTVIARARSSGLAMAAPRQFRSFLEDAATAGLIRLTTIGRAA